MSEVTELGHGHSPAAWTAVVIMLLGFTGGVIAFFFSLSWMVWACVGVVALGLVVGWVLARAGYGVNGPKYVAKQVH